MLMRILIAGAAVLLCAVAVFFLFRSPAEIAAAGLSPETTQAVGQDPADVKPGYVGVAKYGSWRLICAANGVSPPPDATAPGAAVDPANQTSGNTCRVNQEIPVAGKPDQILLAANFGVVGAMHRPALMLRLPPTVHAGDIITMRIDDSHTLRTPVRNCTDKECLAAASLTDDNWSDMQGAGSVQLALPIADNQRILVDLPMDGFQDAISAMMAAQAASSASASTQPGDAQPGNGPAPASAPAAPVPPPQAPTAP